MATIYRFIVEQKTTSSGGRKSSSESSGMSKKSTAKKGKTITLLSSMKGGVESNRKMRAINPLLNKLTGGWYEKGMRVGRAGLGLLKFDEETGKFAGFSGTAIAIIIAFALQTIMKYQNQQRTIAERKNKQNFKMLENGFGQINGAYDISVNVWNGRLTYNQNK